jgi:DNA-binding winged helix-turn-helix (wHTH) protein
MSTAGCVLGFGPFQFLPLQRALHRNGASVRLGSRAREILYILVEQAGTTVTKRKLMSQVWPESVVEEGTLRVHIAALRKALGEGRSDTRYLENVTGQGYRFVAPITLLQEGSFPGPGPCGSAGGKLLQPCAQFF